MESVSIENYIRDCFFIKLMDRSSEIEILEKMNADNLYINGEEYRKKHNEVKKNNIKEALRDNKKLILLDLACGRGGDLGKWQNIDKCCRVVAVDVCKDSVKEAIDRYNKVYKKKDSRMKVFFIGGIDLTEQSAMHDIGNTIRRRRLSSDFNVISCQMALNYFIESEIILLNLLEIVSKYLVSGGIASFSALNGHKIIELLDGKEEHMSDGVYVKSVNIEEDIDYFNCYGMMYKIFIADSNSKADSYFKHKGFSSEFLCFPETLMRIIKNNKQLRLRFWSKGKNSFELNGFGDHKISKLFFYFFLQKY